MKTVVPLTTTLVRSADHHPVGPVLPSRRGGKLASYIALTKPRITLMVLITMGTGFVLGAQDGRALGRPGAGHGPARYGPRLQQRQRAEPALRAGTRPPDVARTAQRPLPAGRLSPVEAGLFGTGLGVAGLVVLASGRIFCRPWWLRSTLLLYVFVYTPLKARTTLNTAIGAVPGACPPVIGWAAATGRLGPEAWALFLIVFLWQFPHFLAIAWIYRDDYAAGRPQDAPLGRPDRRDHRPAGRRYALALVPAGLLPTMVGMAGPIYFAGAWSWGCFYLRSTRCGSGWRCVGPERPPPPARLVPVSAGHSGLAALEPVTRVRGLRHDPLS